MAEASIFGAAAVDEGRGATGFDVRYRQREHMGETFLSPWCSSPSPSPPSSSSLLLSYMRLLSSLPTALPRLLRSSACDGAVLWRPHLDACMGEDTEDTEDTTVRRAARENDNIHQIFTQRVSEFGWCGGARCSVRTSEAMRASARVCVYASFLFHRVLLVGMTFCGINVIPFEIFHSEDSGFSSVLLCFLHDVCVNHMHDMQWFEIILKIC